MHLSDKKGFTLVELLVVISIIAILSVIGITIFTSAQKAARDGKRRADIQALQNAVRQYALINKSFPPAGCSNDVNGTDWPTAFKSALEPNYIQQVPKDPQNGQSSCGVWTCQYCFNGNMWCSSGNPPYTSSDPSNCSTGIGNSWTRLENCSNNSIGDAARFGYGNCVENLFMKSIDPF